ncbi:MAG TPA: hypothetical protein VGJ75_12355 [Dongiaceae bacterium]|jgi:hypothetical protein
MRQAIEIRKYSTCGPRQRSWQARLRTWLFGHFDRGSLVRFDQRSPHLLRDIGLGEDARASHLLQDHNLFRR